jgi:simple sugar transport system substrate-binding protein
MKREETMMKGTGRAPRATLLIAIAGAFAMSWLTAAEAAQPLGDKWCSGFKIRFFAGGGAGDAYGSIVQAGGEQAGRDLGADVEVVFSSWNSEKVVQQMREAIAQNVGGIAVMGFPGTAAMTPLAEEASKAGILIHYMTVNVPDITREFGGGYVGVSDLGAQGGGLAKEAIKRFGLKAGDKVAVFVPLEQKERSAREFGAVDVFKAAGIEVEQLATLNTYGGEPNLAIPVITATVAKIPDLKLIAYPGGQMLGNAEAYMTAAGKKAGEIINIGFDASPQIIDGFEKNWIQLTSDQQPFQQGYLPVLSLCQQHVLGLTPISFETGAGFITPDNYKSVGVLAARGLR